VLRYQGLVRGFLRQLAPEHADDLAQETFLSAYRRIDRFRGDAKFSTWLVSIAYNALRQMQRSRKHQRKIVSALQLEPSAASIEDGHASAHGALMHDLETLLGWLDDDERVTMVLSYAHEYSHREIANITGMPVGTVKSKLARAKVKLLDRLKVSEAQHA